jgi:hypothetical protein
MLLYFTTLDLQNFTNLCHQSLTLVTKAALKRANEFGSEILLYIATAKQKYEPEYRDNFV